MFNAITEYQLHDEGMQKMRPYRKLSLLDILILSKYFAYDFRAERSLEEVINATTTVIIEAFESTTVSLKA